MIFGLDTLGLAQFDSKAIAALPKGAALSAFAVTFGDAEKAVRKACQVAKPVAFKIQMLWSDSHDFGDVDIPKIAQLARKYEAVAKAFPKIKFYLSPFCEHKIKAPDKYLDIVAKEAPSCVPLNTPWTGGISKKYLNEVHGDHTAPRGKYCYSFDGTSSVDANVSAFKRKHKKAEIFWFWHPAFNGRKNSSDPTPRPDREAWPTPDLIKSVWYLRRNKGKTKLPKNYLWKSHADRHETPPEPRAYKPVAIIPVQAPQIELVKGGKVIAKLPYYGIFADGRHRYYAPDYGYILSIKAGHEPVGLRVKGKIVGVINPAFRDGEFRD